jgi:hypothetical protein
MLSLMKFWKNLFANPPPIRRFHRSIIETATKKLGRPLSPQEKKFITSRGGFVALEMISDTVATADKDELVKYLNSE